MHPGNSRIPQVSVVIDMKKNYAPKQNLQKPERSVQLMQQRGIAGQRPPQGAIGGTQPRALPGAGHSDVIQPRSGFGVRKK